MSKYISFTKEQREQARRTDLANFLISQGEKVEKLVSAFNGLSSAVLLPIAQVQKCCQKHLAVILL